MHFFECLKREEYSSPVRCSESFPPGERNVRATSPLLFRLYFSIVSTRADDNLRWHSADSVSRSAGKRVVGVYIWLSTYSVFTVFEQPFVPRGRDTHTALLRRKQGKLYFLEEVQRMQCSRARCVSDVDPRAPFARDATMARRQMQIRKSNACNIDTQLRCNLMQRDAKRHGGPVGFSSCLQKRLRASNCARERRSISWQTVSVMSQKWNARRF